MKYLRIELVKGTDVHQLFVQEDNKEVVYFFMHKKGDKFPKNWRELIVWDYTKTGKMFAKFRVAGDVVAS